jgi:hypothetical protein
MSISSVNGSSFQNTSSSFFSQFSGTGFDNQTRFGNGGANGSGGDPVSQLLQAIIPLLQMAAQMLGGQGSQGGQGGQSPGGGGSCGGGNGAGNVGGPGGTQNPFGGPQSDPMSGLFNSFGELFQSIAPLLQSLGGGGMQTTNDSLSLANQFS